MIGNMFKKIREDKKITKSHLSRETGINLGYLSHIEKEERNPSYKSLKSICQVLGVPYHLLMNIYERKLTEEQEDYKVFEHINYNKIICVESNCSFIDCPEEFYNASMAIKMFDNSMEPTIIKNSNLFIQLGCPLNNKDIGVFLYNDKILIKRFILRKNSLILRSDNKEIPDITLSVNDDFKIIGKIINV